MTDPSAPDLSPDPPARDSSVGPLPRVRQRLLSGLVDLATFILGSLLIESLLLLFIKAGPDGKYTSSQSDTATLVLRLGILVLAVLLFVLPQVRTGRSIGKFLTRIRTVNADGVTPGWYPLLVKYGLMMALLELPLGVLAPLLLLLGWAYAFVNPERRSVFDRIAGTYVVDDEQRPHGLDED